ncbi:hypothetical protein EHF33_04975 [Deinococcus psychrotolerans]|uniref:DUF2178 domain-containing protein n=1 Tax=Deinococcus psychrotolerans TaxID=2489213 RepID=A0A3G8Y9Y7_9DEIO|nr:hypothetical protein [Deinococcus psychrotolerans]AZI42179.1 hypothetical protein EHF33_04975 [Deinococcus psychrotolerans]
MMTRQDKPKITKRERRVWQSMWGMVGAAVAITVIAIVVALLQSRTEGHAHDFFKGMSLGLLAALPVGMGYMLWRIYRQLDEFGQRQQERACAFAFLLSMVATMVAFAVASYANVVVPLWAVYVFGMLTYTAAVVRGAVLAKGERA